MVEDVIRTGKPLLIEIGTEELPIHAVDELSKAFFDAIVNLLRRFLFEECLDSGVFLGRVPQARAPGPAGSRW